MSATAEHDAPRTTERWSALGGVLLSALYLWVVLWLLLATVLPAVGLGWQPAVITSGSMEPLIRPGDVVLTSPTTSTGDIEPGNVVTFESPARDGTLTTHRVLAVNPDGSLRTQGDANVSPDSTPVRPDDVVGRGRLLIPLVGLPLHWLSSGLVLFGLWLVVTAVSVTVVAGSVRGPVRPREASTSLPVEAVDGRPRRVLGVLGRLRPHRLQRAIVARLVAVARRVHDAIYRGWRPNPPRSRRAAPSTAVLVVTALLARSPTSVTVGAVALVLVVLFDPDGPQLRIGRWEQAATRMVRRVASIAQPAPLALGLLVAVVVVGLGAPTLARSSAAFVSMDANGGNSFTATTAFPADLTLWLQDEPEGMDTADAPYSPMTADEPTQTTLYNYDDGDDTAPGLQVQPGATSEFATDDTRVQRWVHTPSADLSIASAELVFHSAVEGFLSAGATVTWYLRHCDTAGGDCVTMASTTLTEADWQQGASGFLERTTGFGSVAHVVPAGRQLELTLTVPTADSDLWFAYDTVDHPSRLEITRSTPGECPGTGTDVRHVTGDTRIEQDNPTGNFATENELHVRSAAGQNRRTLLTVALPTIPDGCTVTGATLLLSTLTSAPGRTIVVQRTATAVDPSTVTWATQPTTSGMPATSPSSTGTTALDATDPVRELYALGNTGLQLRDDTEDSTPAHTNRFNSTEAAPYPDPDGPRLQVTWGP